MQGVDLAQNTSRYLFLMFRNIFFSLKFFFQIFFFRFFPWVPQGRGPLPEKNLPWGTKGKNLKKKFLKKKKINEKKIFLNIKNEYLDVF